MPEVLLFAQAREAAGSSSVHIEGATVREVVAALSTAFGDEMAGVVAASGVWRNGDPADLDDTVAEGDEIAIVPPVSGG